MFTMATVAIMKMSNPKCTTTCEVLLQYDQEQFLKTKQFPIISFTDLHISDLIKKLYVFHKGFYLLTCKLILALARMISVYLLILIV